MRAFGVTVVLTSLACSRAPDDLERYEAAVINGDDDRLQAFEAPPDVREKLVGASAALIFEHHLRGLDQGSVSLRAPAAREAFGLCEAEAFANEPVGAFCSAVLIDDDLVATASHCFGAEWSLAANRCRSTRVAFGYALTARDAVIELRSEDVFACRGLVALDDEIAIVQLDRPVSAPRWPVPIATSAARAGDTLIVSSHGAGLPLKIELAAAVTEVAPESGALTVAMDTFAGSSGGGLYNPALELVGLVDGGAPDWEAVDGCTRAAHSDPPREQAVNAAQLRDAVCAAGWPSLRLCGTQPACGDGRCNGSEAGVCPEDCPEARCGDLFCEAAERSGCDEDCARYADVPESWMGDPEDYPGGRTSAEPSAALEHGCSTSRGRSAPSSWFALLILLRLRRRPDRLELTARYRFRREA